MKYLYLFILFITVTGFSQNLDTTSVKQNPLLGDRFMFNAGLYNSSKKLKFSVNDNGPNDFIQFDESIDYKEVQLTFFFNFNWRFTKKWSLSSEYFALKGSNKWELPEDISWGDVTFKKGSNVRLGSGLEMYRILIGRSMFKRPKHEIGIGIGTHILNTNAFIEGDAYINDHDFSFETKKVSVIAPLPNIGIWYFYTPTPKLGLSAKVDWFSLRYEEYYAALWNVAPGINYQIFKHIGLGLNYRYFYFHAKVNKSYWNGDFNMSYKGYLFSITGNF